LRRHHRRASHPLLHGRKDRLRVPHPGYFSLRSGLTRGRGLLRLGVDRAELDGRGHLVLARGDRHRDHRLRFQSAAEHGPRIRSLRDHTSRSRVQHASRATAAAVTHPSSALDDTIHQRVRLGILAVLSESRRADFAYLKDVLEVTAGNLSQHLAVLEEAGHIQIAKAFEDKRSRTWVTVTRRGRAALASEVATMRALLDGLGSGQRL